MSTGAAGSGGLQGEQLVSELIGGNDTQLPAGSSMSATDVKALLDQQQQSFMQIITDQQQQFKLMLETVMTSHSAAAQSMDADDQSKKRKGQDGEPIGHTSAPSSSSSSHPGKLPKFVYDKMVAAQGDLQKSMTKLIKAKEREQKMKSEAEQLGKGNDYY